MSPGAAPGQRLWASASAAVAATAAQTLIGLVLYSFLIRSLGAETVGVWLALMAAGLLACMADLGLNQVLVRRLALTHADGEAARILETLLAAVALFTGAALLLAWAGFPLWSRWLALAPTRHAQAQHWLPYVLTGLWLNRIADALAGALDGQQRFVARAGATLLALTAGLALTVASVPQWGMVGAAGAFVLQNALLLSINLALVASGTPGLRWWRPRLSLRILQEALRYGLSVQTLILSYLVLEACIKLALARSGSLAAVSYFDLAFRIGKGVRGLLAAAVRVLVPRLARSGSDAAGRQRAYALSFELMLVAALAVFSTLLASAHGIAWLVLGHGEPMFVSALAAALLPWLIYSLTDPALNLALASGRMRWPLRAHLLTLALAATPTFAVPLASFSGWYGLVAVAIIAGCVLTLAGIHHDEQMPWQTLRPLRSASALLAGVLAGLLGMAAPHWLAGWLQWAAVAAVELLFLTLLWRLHPEVRVLLAFGRPARAA